MKSDLAELKGEVLTAIGHPNRIRIVEFLKGSPKCACEIAPVLHLEQSNLSRHMKLLIQTGIVHNWKDGKKVMYEIPDKNVFEILDKVSLILKNMVKNRMEVLEIENC